MIFEGRHRKSIYEFGEEKSKCVHMAGTTSAGKQICGLGVICTYTDFGGKMLCDEYRGSNRCNRF